MQLLCRGKSPAQRSQIRRAGAYVQPAKSTEKAKSKKIGLKHPARGRGRLRSMQIALGLALVVFQIAEGGAVLADQPLQPRLQCGNGIEQGLHAATFPGKV